MNRNEDHVPVVETHGGCPIFRWRSSGGSQPRFVWNRAGNPSEKERAAVSLPERPVEMFTVNRLVLSPGLTRCLVSTNVIESPHSGARLRTRKVCRWREGEMVPPWATAGLLMTERNFR